MTTEKTHNDLSLCFHESTKDNLRQKCEWAYKYCEQAHKENDNNSNIPSVASTYDAQPVKFH